MRQLERLNGPKEIMQLCLETGAATFAGTIDYESGYQPEERREWDLYILFMMRHSHYRADGADAHVWWLKRARLQNSVRRVARRGRRAVSQLYRHARAVARSKAKQWWRDLLAQQKLKRMITKN
jgi:hypothetical protein